MKKFYNYDPIPRVPAPSPERPSSPLSTRSRSPRSPRSRSPNSPARSSARRDVGELDRAERDVVRPSLDPVLEQHFLKEFGKSIIWSGKGRFCVFVQIFLLCARPGTCDISLVVLAMWSSRREVIVCLALVIVGVFSENVCLQVDKYELFPADSCRPIEQTPSPTSPTTPMHPIPPAAAVGASPTSTTTSTTRSSAVVGGVAGWTGGMCGVWPTPEPTRSAPSSGAARARSCLCFRRGAGGCLGLGRRPCAINV